MDIDGEDNQREVPCYLLVFSGANSGTRTSSSHPNPLAITAWLWPKWAVVIIGILLPDRNLPQGHGAWLYRWHRAQHPGPGDQPVLHWSGLVS